jgi:hypothetical protein
LIDDAKGYEKVREIPKVQRYLNRPKLTEIFRNAGGDKARRDRGIAEAVGRWGYSEREVADYLMLHYSTVSRLITRRANIGTSKSKTWSPNSNLAAVFYERGWSKEALAVLRRGIQTFPDDEELKTFLKDVENNLDDPDGDVNPLLSLLLLTALIHKKLKKKFW